MVVLQEDDGTYFIQAIIGRRVRKSGNRIQKFTGVYVSFSISLCVCHKQLVFQRTESNVSLADMTAFDSKYEYEYLVKFKGLSYLKVQWLTATDIGENNNSFLCDILTVCVCVCVCV